MKRWCGMNISYICNNAMAVWLASKVRIIGRLRSYRYAGHEIHSTTSGWAMIALTVPRVRILRSWSSPKLCTGHFWISILSVFSLKSPTKLRIYWTTSKTRQIKADTLTYQKGRELCVGVWRLTQKGEIGSVTSYLCKSNLSVSLPRIAVVSCTESACRRQGPCKGRKRN